MKAWRRERRGEMIALRMGLDAGKRRESNARIDRFIEQGFPLLANMVIGFCWPYRAEYDARFVMKRFRDRGAITALPAVIAKKTALEFRNWRAEFAMKKGVYDIPVPEPGQVVIPDAIVLPMVAFDPRGYRLGYGGGYFDITLAAIAPRPIAIGVAYEIFKLETLHPQPHDIRMDFVVTENGIYAPEDESLTRLDEVECGRRAQRLACERKLPRMQNPAHAARGYSSPPCYAHEVAPGYFGETSEKKN